MPSADDKDVSLIFELARTHAPQDPYAFRFEPQTYTLRTEGGGRERVEIDWSPQLLADIDAIRRADREPVVLQRLGDTLSRFLEHASWSSRAEAIGRALDAGQRVVITIRSSAAEIYALPWELLTLPGRGQHLGALPRLLLRYEWPDTHTAMPPSPRPHGGRILLAWSAAAGAVPAAAHETAIRRACAQAHPHGEEAITVLPHASLTALSEALVRAEQQGRPYAVLHVLCHGGRSGRSFGLVLDSDRGPITAGPNDWRTLLAPHTASLRLVLLAACEGGNAGEPGNHLGSVAQALHATGLAAVVASRHPLSRTGSVTLSRTLYEGMLGEHETLEQALLRARRQLTLEPRYLDWAALQLYARAEDGVGQRPFVVRPYRGWSPFESSHAAFFEGRAATRDVAVGQLDALASAGRPRLLVVTGASGTGKSSLVRAGVLPKLLRGGFAGQVPTIVGPGDDPLRALEQALATCPVAPLRRLVVVDPLDALLAGDHDDATRQTFMRRLGTLARDEHASACILVLRSDSLRRCRELHLDDEGTSLGIIADDSRHRLALAPMDTAQLRAAILEPARRVGLIVPHGLADRIVADVDAQPGALPLLQHALDCLWQERRGAELSADAYDRLGAVVGMLERHADALIEAFDDRERVHARRILTALVSLGDDGAADTCRRSSIERLWPADPAERPTAEAVLGRLVDQRLVVRGQTTELGATAELAHEGLVRRWRRLGQWLQDERQRRVGRYMVLEVLRDDEHGRVCVGHDPQLDRRVLLTVLPAAAGGPEAQARQLEQARLLARLSHPSAPTVHDVGVTQGRVYLASERLGGEPLEAWAQRAPRTWRELAGVVRAIADLLGAAHRLGVAHHRVSAAAIQIDANGVPRLVDWSLRPGPEVQPTLDITDLCATARGLLLEPGRPPVPEALRGLLERGTTPELASRWPSLEALLTELDRVLEAHDGSKARAEAPAEPPKNAATVRLERPGGIVASRSAFYVAHPEIEDLCLREIVEPGALIRIKGPQHMGKATLMTRVLERPKAEGWRIALVDFQLLDDTILSSLARFLQWLCATITRRLKMPKVDDFWDDVYGAKDNCTAYFEDYLLEDGRPLVLAINHLDRLFDHPKVAEELLALLRAWHEMSRSQPPWDELRLLLAYSTEMYLPMNINHSPFNVGLAVPMEDWSPQIVLDLALRHGLSWGVGEVEQLMAVLGGHPHLVRIALHQIAEHGLDPSEALAAAATDEGPFAEHLKKILWKLEQQPALYEAATRVMNADGPVRLSTELAFKLASLGIARLQGNGVVPGRELYQRYLCAVAG